MTRLFACFLRDPATGRVLLIRRSDAAEAHAGRWAGLTGRVESEAAVVDARRACEDAGFDARFVRAGDAVAVADGDREWTLSPYLFEASGAPTPDDAVAEAEWVHATAVLERATVPGLWTAYRRVGPSAETVASDRDHGSAWLSLRALEALRDAAADAELTGAGFEPVAEAARSLRDARPSMAVVENRVNRVLAEADPTPEAVRRRAASAVDAAVEADAAAASEAASLLDGVGRVATLSRSGTVADALSRVECGVVVAESRPGREGVAAAAALVDGREVTLTTDAALPGLSFDAAVVGADAVLPDGSVVNKVGSYPLALAAERAGVPCYAVAARDKIRTDESVFAEERPAAELSDGDADLSVANPTFERVPADLVRVVTDAGVLDDEAVAAVAEGHRDRAAWDESDPRRG